MNFFLSIIIKFLAPSIIGVQVRPWLQIKKRENHREKVMKIEQDTAEK
jgi:hypothetical protein